MSNTPTPESIEAERNMHRHCDADLMRLGNQVDNLKSDLARAQRTQHMTEAFWYACGYNDHRQQETGRVQPWVDGHLFAEAWVIALDEGGSRPSLQDFFKGWMRAQS